MTTFDEAVHPRTSSGRFATKGYSEASPSLLGKFTKLPKWLVDPEFDAQMENDLSNLDRLDGLGDPTVTQCTFCFTDIDRKSAWRDPEHVARLGADRSDPYCEEACYEALQDGRRW